MKELHNTEDEPVAEILSAFDFDFELFDFSREEYKDLIYEEIMLYHSEEKLQEYVKNKRKYPNGLLYEKHIQQQNSHNKL